LTFPKSSLGGAVLWIFVAKYCDSQEGGIDCAGFANGERPDWNATGIWTMESNDPALEAQIAWVREHGQSGFSGGHTSEMRCAPGSGDNISRPRSAAEEAYSKSDRARDARR